MLACGYALLFAVLCCNPTGSAILTCERNDAGLVCWGEGDVKLADKISRDKVTKAVEGKEQHSPDQPGTTQQGRLNDKVDTS